MEFPPVKYKPLLHDRDHSAATIASFAIATNAWLGLLLFPACSGLADNAGSESSPTESAGAGSELEVESASDGTDFEASTSSTAAPPESRFSGTDYAVHVETLERKYAGLGYHIIVEKPFVVIGNGSKQEVARRASGTVRWAVRHLKKAFFAQDPHSILDIWLFVDKDSYEEGARNLTGYDAGTPFGFYSPHAKALVMNISTGGGTLVHEIVHPFVESNFPDCPAWFNEGLGSLYEQCESTNGKIMGLTNWRLAGLQEALRAGTVPPFKELCEMDSTAFYGRDRGTNYSQARYLCYYLQEQGLLRAYYKAFHAAHKSDPGGFATLKAILKRDDVDAFQKEWSEYVLGLRY